MSKKNVHKLTNESETTSILLGISSHENDYRVSWALNEHLGFRFAKTENYKALNKRLNEFQEFSTYIYINNDSNTYRLISNRCDNGFLIEELRNIDFLLIIEENKGFPLQNLLAKIKSIPFISAIFPIEPSSLKKKSLSF